MTNTIPKMKSKPLLNVPANFDPLEVLPPDLQQHADSARYILHRIIWGKIFRKTDTGGYVYLKYDYLREVIPSRIIKPLKVSLVDAGVIESDNHYIEGRKAMGYRLGPEYIDAPIVRMKITDKQVETRHKEKQRKEYKKVRLDVHCHLRKQFQRLDVDLAGALEVIKNHRDYEHVKIPVENINDKTTFFGFCRFGRVHTSLTQCPKNIRPFLYVDGEKLVSIDIKNSQPLFFALLLINYRRCGNNTHSFITFNKNKVDPYRNIDQIISNTITTLKKREDERKEEEEPHLCTTPYTAITTLPKCHDGSKSVEEQQLKTIGYCPTINVDKRLYLRDDEALFVRLCEEGRLYEHFVGMLDYADRRWVKNGFFEVAFGQNRTRSEFKPMFAEEFPNVWGVMKKHKKKEYQFLAQLMQNYESNLVINHVCRSLMQEFPQAPVFTIHDSILTTPDYVGDVQRIMTEEFVNLELTPQFHVEDYGAGDFG